MNRMNSLTQMNGKKFHFFLARRDSAGALSHHTESESRFDCRPFPMISKILKNDLF
jgi:hypothetical protein